MATTEGNEGNLHPVAPLNPGLYVPTVAFFASDDTIDIGTTVSHTVQLIRSGIAGLVTHGSNGEAVHLSHPERQLINRTTRKTCEQEGVPDMPLIVGCGTQSTRETIQLCQEAAGSGGTHVMILPPSYYGALLTTDLIIDHFRSVADASPLPVLIYNFPAASGGLDLSSDTILELAKHPNIVGVKLTCGNTGKLARVVAGNKDSLFRTFGGSADFTIQTLAAGGHGVIAGLGNLAPRACVELIRLWHAGKLAEAAQLQGVVARGDWAAIKGGFVSIKAALQRYHSYGGLPRRPCALLEGGLLESQMAEFEEIIEMEKQLAC